MNTTILVAVLGIIFAPILSYALAARRLSGKIETSAAEDLWAESRSIREDLTQRNEFLLGRIATLEEKVEQLEKRNRELYFENGKLRRHLDEQERTIKTLRAEVDHLRLDNDRLQEEKRVLELRVKELEEHNGGT